MSEPAHPQEPIASREPLEPESVAMLEVDAQAAPPKDAQRIAASMPAREEEAAVKDGREEQSTHAVLTGDEAAVRAQSARRTRRSFLVGGVTAAAAYGAAQWIGDAHLYDRLQAPLRNALLFNARLAREAFAERGLAPEYPVSEAVPLRLNGSIGLDETLQPASWRLQLAGIRNAQSSPLYVKDVTAWEYKYAGAMPASQQAEDVKSAPGNGFKSKSGDDDEDDDKSKPEDANGAPKAQQSQGMGSAKNAALAAKQGGSDPSSAGLKNPKTDLNPSGASDSAAGAAVAARFQQMASRGQRKRNVGDAEAGPSYSSLDIGTPGLLLTMAELQKLPKVEFVTQFKCVEGWSNITHWGGYRLRDLLDLYPPALENGKKPRYIYMETPDGNYYGGYNMSAARHPQTLLVTEMHGQPLTQDHGAPLRLHMPIKYGYKQLKRIGLIAYSFQKPDDYWTHLGYDWFAGL